MEYDSMQLLLGSILFVTTLFLLTTILVYYVFFTALQLVVGSGSIVLLWIGYVIIQDFPLGTAVARFRHPEKFTARIVIDETSFMLEPVPESVGSILLNQPRLARRVQGLTSWLGTQLSDVFSGRRTLKTIVECLAWS